jgi:VCBS repeat-containing protein
MENNTNIPSLNDIPAEDGAEAAVSAQELQFAALNLAQAQARGNAAVPAGAQRVTPGPDGVVVLPAEVSLNDIKVSGRDLLVQMPDGSVMVIVDGAVLVPQLVFGNVEVPATSLAALLIGQEIQPAAGPPQSSGGNFAVDVGGLGDPIGLGDLLPPTALEFPEPEQRDIIPDFEEDDPGIIIVTPEFPDGAVEAVAVVDEAGLPERGDEPEGTEEPSNLETTTGTIVIDDGNGPAVVTINGVAITEVGQEIEGEYGVLTINSISPTAITFTYLLTDNGSGDDVTDVFNITVTDSDGDVALATLNIDVIDDQPIARDDTDSIPSGSFGPAIGNVFTGEGTTSGVAGADTPGADDATITGVHEGLTGTFVAVDGPTVVQGEYGVLTLNEDGSYSYVRDPGTPGGVTEVFTYQLTDGDGDPDTATLTITLEDAGISTGDGNAAVLLDDDALAGGNAGGVGDDVNSANTIGSLAVEGGDGALTYAFQLTGAPAGFEYVASGNNVLVQQGGVTVLTVTLNTATGAYTVVQNAPIDHALAGAENNQLFNISYTVTDADGDTATGTLPINVDDDTPVAANDLDSLSDGAVTATGNVITDAAPSDAADGDSGADSVGADGGIAVLGVSSNNVPANSDTVADGGGNFSVVGQYGTLTLNQNGSYSYQLTADSPGNVNEVFTYTITDADGDTTTATLTITIAAVNGQPTAGGNVVLIDDDALAGGNPGGDNDDADAVNTDGTLVFDFGPDGGGSISFLTTGEPAGFDYVASGDDLLIQQDGVTVITITLNPTTGEYTVVQNAPIDHSLGGTENNQPFTVTYRVTDANGDFADGTLQINADDDTPILVEQGSLTLNVEEDDISNAQSQGNDEDLSGVNETDTGSLAALVSVGADADGTFSFNPAVLGDAVVDSLGNPVTSQGQPVLYFISGNVLTGYVDVGGGAGYQPGTDRPVFTFTITDTAAGTVSFTLIDQIDHPEGLEENSLSLDLANTVQFTDGDGDSVVLDNGPTIAVQDDIPVGPEEEPTCEDNVTGNNPDAAVIIGNLGISIGTDEPMVVENFEYTGPPLTAGGGFEVLFSSEGNVITAYIDTNGGADGGEEPVFTLTLDPETGDYTFDLIMPLDGTTTLTEITGGTAHGAGPTTTIIGTGAGDEDLALVAGWEVTGFDTGAWTGTFTQGEVNSSANGYGVGNANLDSGEILRFDFNDADPGPGGYVPPAFDGPPVGSASFELSNFQSTDVLFYRVVYANPDGSFNSAAIVQISSTDLVDGTLQIDAPAGLFLDSVEIYNEDGNGMIDLVAVGTYSQTVDVCLDFDVGLTDFDGDPVDTTIHVTINQVEGTVRGDVSLAVVEAAIDTDSTGDDDSGDIAPGAVDGSTPNALTETDSDSGITFVAGSSAITSITFGDPNVAGNEITINGLEEGVVVTWVLSGDGRTLTGSIGSDEVIILQLSGDQTAATGDPVTPTVTVTLTDAFPHQDDPNGSQISLSQIEINANQADGGTITGLATRAFTEVTAAK